MAKILCIESATTNCSVCLSIDGEVVSIKEENTPNYSHSEQLHVFMDAVLHEASLSFSELNAVAVSKGPGSYTGLRIGVSAAKGLCFALDVPLIAIPTLESMTHQVELENNEVVIPVLDARRMEVYSGVFNATHQEIRKTEAEIIDSNSFQDYMPYSKVYVVGSGAEKCQEMLTGKANFVFDATIFPSAKQMAQLSEKKFQAGEFEDVAYFEPYYLKDFVLQTKKS